MTNRYAVKKYCIPSFEVIEAKKIVALKINQFTKDKKLTHKDVQNILKIAMCKITAVKQMSLGNLDLKTLESFLERLEDNEGDL